MKLDVSSSGNITIKYITYSRAICKIEVLAGINGYYLGEILLSLLYWFSSNWFDYINSFI